MQTPPLWYIPSFYGDIRLERVEYDDSCRIFADHLTEREVSALGDFERRAIAKGWVLRAFEPRPQKGQSATFTCSAPIDKAAKMLSKILKPGRTIVSAVRFSDSDGVMEEHKDEVGPRDVPKAEVVKKKPAAATSVAAPHRGCPAPDFPAADLKARAVLEAFLAPDQVEDFRRYQRFISVGQTTGRRYMVTSRHARDALATYHRSLFDLEDQFPLCVHDWSVPAAEEMLALHVLLGLPGWEGYLRELEA